MNLEFVNNIIALQPAFKKNILPIVFATDNNFVPVTGVAITSLIAHSNPKYNYDIIILERGISDINKKMLLSLQKSNVSIRFVDMSFIIDNILPNAKPTWYRLFIPKLCSLYEKVFYSDVDVIFQSSLVELFNEDLQDNMIGAVPDLFLTSTNLINQIKNNLGLTDGNKYFNGGVLLFNIQKINQEAFLNQTMNILKTKKLLFLDQDVLNLAFEGHVKLLDIKWNFLTVYNTPSIAANITIYKDQLFEAQNFPQIVHFAGANPIYHWKQDTSYLFWMYARQTPFYEKLLFITTENMTKKPVINYSFAEKIFSVKNLSIENNTKIKIIRILGLKFKFKVKKKLKK